MARRWRVLGYGAMGRRSRSVRLSCDNVARHHQQPTRDRDGAHHTLLVGRGHGRRTDGLGAHHAAAAQFVIRAHHLKHALA